MNNILPSVGLIAVLFASTPAMAIMYRIECPQQISTQQSLMQPVGNEWTPMTDTSNSPQILNGVSLFDGIPSSLGELKPDNGDSDEPYRAWSFGQGGVNNLWAVCRYSNTSMYLAQRLPPMIRACKATYNQGVRVEGNAQVRDFICHRRATRDEVTPGLNATPD
ncbi:MAG: STY0301 family protein [Rickettsiales bacterium]